MGARRGAREMALQVLCLLDAQPQLTPIEGLNLYFRHLLLPDDDEAPAEPDPPVSRRIAEGMVTGVRGAVGELDAALSRCSRNWRLERMAWVDRNLLRLGAYELIYCSEVPARVALNEAIELAKVYGTVESSAFINGVLDRVLAEQGRRTTASPPGG